MIVRVIHFKIKPGKLDEYLGHFSAVEERAAGFEGLSFFKLFKDREDPNTLFLFTVFDNEENTEKWAEIGPTKEYSDTVQPLIEEFGLAMSYDVSEAKSLF